MKKASQALTMNLMTQMDALLTQTLKMIWMKKWMRTSLGVLEMTFHHIDGRRGTRNLSPHLHSWGGLGRPQACLGQLA